MTVAESQGTAVLETKPHEVEDAAWVSIETGLSEAELRAFIADIERLWRINPLLDCIEVTLDGSGRGRLKMCNLANARDISVAFTVREAPNGIDVEYAEGLKTRTSFRIEPASKGARLVVREEYGGAASAEESKARLDEVDTSLNAWGRALSDYLKHWRRWSRFAPWRWYMRRVWLPMSPSARRIVFLIWAISLVEVVSIAALGLVLALRSPT